MKILQSSLIKRIWQQLLGFKIIHSIIIVFLLFLISYNYSFISINNYIYDLSLYLNSTKETQNKIIIVEIDEKSLQALGNWPWKRSIHTQLLRKLFNNGALIAAFYVKFDHESDINEDTSFINQLNKHPTALLIDPTENKKNNAFVKELNKSSSIGHNVFSVNRDNIIREQLLFTSKIPSFALAILKLYNKTKYNQYLKLSNNDNVILINYKRDQNQFPRYSYSDILNNKINPKELHNKIVLIAPTLKGISSFYVTPFSRNQSSLLSGTTSAIMVQAQILDSLINYEPIQAVNPKLTYFLLFVFIILLLNLNFQLSTYKQLILSLVIIPALIILISLILLLKMNLWLSSPLFIIACIISFATTSINVMRNTNKLLDNYIGELSGQLKKDINIDLQTSMDLKLLSLKGLTDLVNADKNVLETVLVSVNSIIMLFDTKGNLIYSNKPYEFNIGYNITKLSNDVNIDEIKEITSKQEVYKKCISLKQGHYNLFVSLAKDNYYVGILNDITDMVKINEMKTDLLRMLSHEFKTSLATILLCSDYLSQLNKEKSLNRHIDKISNQTEFLEEMIDDFLVLNKLEIPDFELSKEIITIKSFIEPIINNLQVISESKNISITYDIKDKTPENINIDKKYFSIAIKNLIDNAIKYSPNDTKITINISLETNNIIISIKDQGFGISDNNLNQLFNKFYRIKTDNTKLIKGTGLGLSFVKRIVELHNGDIKVYSEENVGSEFVINVPA